MTERVVDRRHEVADVDGVVDGFGGEAVALAVDLASLHSAAGEDCAVDSGPAVAAGRAVAVDVGSAAEFAGPNVGTVNLRTIPPSGRT